MASTTRVVGIMLILLGIVYFFVTGSRYPTSLIPCGFGAVLLVCGLLAATEDAGRRMLWMHIAVTFGLLGFLVPAWRATRALTAVAPRTAAMQNAVTEQIIMAGISLVFVVLCVRSFVAARRGRLV